MGVDIYIMSIHLALSRLPVYSSRSIKHGFKPSVLSEGFFLIMRFVASIPHEAKRAQSRSANS